MLTTPPRGQGCAPDQLAGSTDRDRWQGESPATGALLRPPPGSIAVGRARMVMILGALIALGPLTMDVYLPALPRIGDEFSVPSSVSQLTLTATLIGLALGQLIVGPISDAFGRRRPLLVGIVLLIAASGVCAVAPSIVVLGVGRGAQGLGAAASMVVTLAVVGDLFAESTAAKVMSRLMLVLGVVPILAPSAGAAVLVYGTWRGIFVVLIAIGGALLVMAAMMLPETLPQESRREMSMRAIATTYQRLLADARFVSVVLAGGLGMSALFVYIAGASFVLQERFGLTQQTFALAFSAGALALITASQFNIVLLRCFSPQAIMMWSLAAATLSSAVFAVLMELHYGGLAGFIAPVAAVMAAMGLVIPNAPAIALSIHPEAAGTAAALLGATQCGIGAVIAPVVGLMGNDAVTMAAAMTAGSAIALAALTIARCDRSS